MTKTGARQRWRWDLTLFFEPGQDGIQREEKCMYWMRVPEVCGKNVKGEVFIIQPAESRTEGLVEIQKRGEKKIKL